MLPRPLSAGEPSGSLESFGRPLYIPAPHTVNLRVRQYRTHQRVAVTHFTPTSNPAEWDADMEARWESFQVCDCGPCEHIRSEQRQAKLDTGELSG